MAVEGEFVWVGLSQENAICEGEIETVLKRIVGRVVVFNLRRKNSARFW